MKRKYIILVVVALFFIGSIKVIVFDNWKVMFVFLSFMDNPSKGYVFFQKRIYKIAAKTNLGNKILKELYEKESPNLRNIYIKTLGVIGERSASGYLIKCYSKYQNDEKHKDTVWYLIMSAGMIGNNDLVPLLETLLNNYHKHRITVTRYAIARSLYLITGRRYNYKDDYGEERKIILTNDLIMARKVIESSIGRKRTYNEMLILDRLYYSPDL